MKTVRIKADADVAYTAVILKSLESDLKASLSAVKKIRKDMKSVDKPNQEYLVKARDLFSKGHSILNIMTS